MKKRPQSHFIPVGNLVEQVATRLVDHPRNQALRVWREWCRAVGDTIARHTEPIRLLNGLLTLRVDSPSWSNQLVFLKPDLLEQLNANLLPENKIRDIRFQHGILKGLPRTTPTKPPPPVWPAPLSEEEARARALVTHITHPPLQEVMYRVILKNMIRKRLEKEIEPVSK
ncbi:MAG: DUF721 domain-containing protein [Magnetococcus sp. DMHC-6]